MDVLTIRKYPDKILRKNCLRVKEITEKEKELFQKMLFTMRFFSGIGLAAPQVGILAKLVVAEVEEEIIKLANPEILKVKGTDNMKEGCLSLPDLGVDIERAYELIVKGLNENGRTVEIKAKGLLARVLQHEIDHLEGKLIIDYASMLKKMEYKLKNKR
jgi:peptide deformylase